MAEVRFKNQAAATKWLKAHDGLFLDENTKEGKWAAYVPHNLSKDGMAIGYGDTVPSAVAAVAEIVEG